MAFDVFGSIHAMNARNGEVRIGQRSTVEFVFQRHGQRFVSRGIGAGKTGWRHHARAQLAHHFFPRFGVFADVREIQFVEHQARSL